MPARLRSLVAFVAVVALIMSSPPVHAAGDLNATANANTSNQIVIEWSWYEYDPGVPVGRPDWVGYDLYRRDPAVCSPWVRLSEDIIPRVPGVSHGGTIVDTPPATLTTWEYKLIMVDAARNEIILVWPEGCEPPCAPHAWESIPKLAGPVTVGTIDLDLGWAVVITPCLASCWYSFTVSEPQASLLRPYLGTGEAFRFFGDEFFGTFEGSPLYLDHFEPAGCGPTPTTRPSWGSLKTLYR
jgi:hypothetical protein